MIAAGMKIFGSTFQCECGRIHSIEPKEALYEAKVAKRLPELCRKATVGRRATVLMDSRTRQVAGENVLRALKEAGWQATGVVAPDPSPGRSPACDDATKELLASQVGDTDIFVPVGAGVITDLARWLALERRRPFVSFATAASMNGYASASIAATIKGVKSLIYAHAPYAVAADPQIIRDAPWELTASGLGDVLAKPISTADWHMNHLIFGDYYCPRVTALVVEIEPLYADHPEELRRRSPKAIEALFQGLLLTGVAMNMADTTAPASGAEHMVSHVLDMMAIRDEIDHDLHGRQVGVGTILAAEIYQRVLALESPIFSDAPQGVDRAFWGPMADEVEKHYRDKIERLLRIPEMLSKRDAWDRLRQSLATMVRKPTTIHSSLSRAGAAYCAEHIRCSKDRLRQALLHGHEIRSRITVLDLAWLTGLMPRAAEEAVERWG